MLKEIINKFVEDHLPQEIDFGEKSKFIHDSLWGTIELFDYELCIIDTPLLQRLRFIHQTGFVYETFPSATHSRFEHTLGAMFIASRIISTLELRYPEYITNDSLRRVRLAAIFHDTGHSAYSHSSEEVYQNMKDMKDLLRGGENIFHNKGAGEVLSYLILTSDAFREYFQKIKAHYPTLKYIDIDEFAPYILGRSTKDLTLYEANIISGPFDADKLDYFPRDGRASGIDISLDIARLIHCLEIVPFKKEMEDESEVLTLVMNRGGFNAAQQLLFARASLFATVYHHQKVRAGDCMFKSCINYLQTNDINIVCSGSSNDGVSLKSSANFLYMNDSDFYNVINNSNKNSNEVKLVKSIYEREFLKRTLTISFYTLFSNESPEQRSSFSLFKNLINYPDILENLRQEIITASKLQDKSASIWIDIPKKPSFEKAGHALINMSSRNRKPKIEKLAAVIPIMDWVQTYEQFYAQSFLFGPRNKEDRIKLAVAAIKIFKSFTIDIELVKKLNIAEENATLGLILSSNAVSEDIKNEVKHILGNDLPD